MIVADDVRAVWPRHAMKRLAAGMDVSLHTARGWLHRTFVNGIAPRRRRELALLLLAELDAQEPNRAALRGRLTDLAA